MCNTNENLSGDYSMKDNCTFCKILKCKEADPTFISTLDCGSLFLNLNQHYPGRCLFILNHHSEHFHELEDEEFARFNRSIKLLGARLEALYRPDLINYALLGNHVQHVHWHIIPRYKTDENWGGPPWPASTKTLSEDEYRDVALKIRESIKGLEDEPD